MCEQECSWNGGKERLSLVTERVGEGRKRQQQSEKCSRILLNSMDALELYEAKSFELAQESRRSGKLEMN